VASVGLGIAIAHLLAAATVPSRSPLVAVGSVVIDLAPTPVKEAAVAWFGTADKPLLLGGLGVVILLLAAGCGLLARRSPLAGAALASALGLVAAGAALTRPGAGPGDAVPGILGAAAAGLTLGLVSRALRRAPDRPGPLPVDRGPDDAPAAGSSGPGAAAASACEPRRRTVLAAGLGVLVGAALVGGLGELIGRRRADVSALRAGIRLPQPVDPGPPLPADAELGVTGITPFRVPNADFYRVDTALTVPVVDPSTWTLQVGGMVRAPYEMSFDELLSLPMIERDLTLTCVSNEVGGPYAGNARWLGVPLRDVLARAGVDPAAEQLLSRSADGWSASTPLAAVTDGRDALIAVAMNGEPLPPEHGFPARMVVPGLFGFVSATKWLVSLEATTYAAEQAYWTRRGWATDAPVRTMARIEVPRPLASVPAGTVVVGGVCWAQHRGIDGVEVQVDDGPWRMATLGGVPSDDTWRQWSYVWRGATAGRHTVRARATDSTGATQPEERRTPFPSGATGWHDTVVTVL
jgi:DMSO/TMAO reductase YedYZ molybdopterin-dependent catalytic subunit